jgi:ABC-2 type transport system permease protein
LPFWIIALFELAFGLFIAWVLFDVPFEGGVGIIFLFANIYIPVVLGLGMFISTFTNTQQQAMFLTWFLLVIFILMSGLFTPIEYMPSWAIQLTYINPVAYFVEFMRMVMLKGSGFNEVANLFAAMGVYALIINALAVWNYRKVAI